MKCDDNEFFIPINVPSSKNSKRWTGKILISSKIVMDYRSNTAGYWLQQKRNFINALKGKDKPYKIGFHFVRDSRRRYDFINPLQTAQDEMVKYGWIEDDNIFELIPFPYERNGSYSTVDKLKAGVYIKIF